jgi:hypothetical protein
MDGWMDALTDATRTILQAQLAAELIKMHCSQQFTDGATNATYVQTCIGKKIQELMTCPRCSEVIASINMSS